MYEARSENNFIWPKILETNECTMAVSMSRGYIPERLSSEAASTERYESMFWARISRQFELLNSKDCLILIR